MAAQEPSTTVHEVLQVADRLEPNHVCPQEAPDDPRAPGSRQLGPRGWPRERNVGEVENGRARKARAQHGRQWIQVVILE
jgi:hypothetical protein